MNQMNIKNLKFKSEYIILAVLFALSLGLRLFFALQTTEFSSDQTYFTLRQVDNIRQTGLPIFYDELSYGGKDQIALPGFYYLLAIFSYFMSPMLVVKIIPNILASTMVFVVYFLVFHITKNKRGAIAGSFVSIFIPIFVSTTANTAAIYSIAVPVFFLMIYFFLKIEEGEKYLYPFLALFVILSFMDSSIFILVIALPIYLLLRTIEKLKITRAEIEVTLFSMFLACWFMFLFFKKALLFHGPRIIWQNLPRELLFEFSGFNIVTLIYLVGFMPVLFGAYIIYRHLRVNRKKSITLMISIALALIILLSFGLIRLYEGIMFFGVILAIFSGVYFCQFETYIDTTKFSRWKMTIITISILLFIMTSGFSTIFDLNDSIIAAPSEDSVSSLIWLRNNTQKNSVILASLDEGNLVTYYANRKNVIDRNFLLVDGIEQRYSDLNTMFTIPYKTNAINLMNKYDVDYIFWSDKGKEHYGTSTIPYIEEDDPCWDNIFEKGVIQIYRSKCIIEESRKEED